MNADSGGNQDQQDLQPKPVHQPDGEKDGGPQESHGQNLALAGYGFVLNVISNVRPKSVVI